MVLYGNKMLSFVNMHYAYESPFNPTKQHKGKLTNNMILP